jgi:hypothetical protein
MNDPRRKRSVFSFRLPAFRLERPSSAVPHRPLLIACLLIAAASCTGDANTPNSITEDFVDRRYDRKAWEIHLSQLPDASFRVRDEGLVIRVPAAATGDKPAAFKSQFLMSGDFDIGCEYSLKSFPTPEKGSVNFGIWLDGPAGMATFRRTNQAIAGTGFAMWDKSSEEDAKSRWRLFRMPPDVQEGRSELVVQRRGPEVQFLGRTSPEAELLPLATLEYPGDIESMQVRVQTDEVSEPVEVQVHSIRVAADRIVFENVEPPWWTTRTAKIAAGVLILLMFAAAYLLLRNRPAAVA